ncbi:MAG: shikimate kinase [Gemmatimonadota bacterium]
MRRPVILIGLPGAGKTTAAPQAAALLDAPWCDLDQRVVERAGLSIPEIFAQHGEERFRALERLAMDQLLDEPPQVIAAGAGWAAQPGNLAAVATRALVLYMSLTPAQAALRVPGNTGRPLLSGEAPERRIAELLAARERWYRLADLEIAVGDAPPDAVAAGIATAARQYGGW